MIKEAANDEVFQTYFKDCSLDGVMEALKITKSYIGGSRWSEDTKRDLTVKLWETEIIKPEDSFLLSIVKSHTLITFYQENTKNCDEATAQWGQRKN